MITNKDIRVENGFLIINGDKYPLDGQSPEAIMQIVEDNSDSTPTENSTAPVTSGGVFTALGGKQDTLTFDTTPTENSKNPVESGGVYTAIAEVVKRERVTATTDTNGLIRLTDLYSTIGTSNILNATVLSTDGNEICQIIGTGGGLVILRIVNNVTFAVVASKSITVDVLYKGI